MKKAIIIIMVIIFISSLFLPVFEGVMYDYDCAEADIRKIVERYSQNIHGASVSVLKYRQSTGGCKWEIKSSTDNNLTGTVFPVWLVSPMFLSNDDLYENNTFLYREIIVVTEAKEKLRKINYDGEKCTIVFPRKIIVAAPGESDHRIYRVCDLSVIGIIILYFKVCIILFAIWLIVRAVFRVVMRIRENKLT